jgi:hypothetical protein
MDFRLCSLVCRLSGGIYRNVVWELSYSSQYLQETITTSNTILRRRTAALRKIALYKEWSYKCYEVFIYNYLTMSQNSCLKIVYNSWVMESDYPPLPEDLLSAVYDFLFHSRSWKQCGQQITKSKSKLCYDRRSAGQSVLEQSTHLGLTTRSW